MGAPHEAGILCNALEKFQSHEAAELDVLGFANHTHATAAQLLEDPVVGDYLSDHEWRENGGVRILSCHGRSRGGASQREGKSKK
jgi:hypothetical protein